MLSARPAFTYKEDEIFVIIAKVSKIMHPWNNYSREKYILRIFSQDFERSEMIVS